jgi:hypothetical protein
VHSSSKSITQAGTHPGQHDAAASARLVEASHQQKTQQKTQQHVQQHVQQQTTQQHVLQQEYRQLRTGPRAEFQAYDGVGLLDALRHHGAPVEELGGAADTGHHRAEGGPAGVHPEAYPVEAHIGGGKGPLALKGSLHLGLLALGLHGSGREGWQSVQQRAGDCGMSTVWRCMAGVGSIAALARVHAVGQLGAPGTASAHPAVSGVTGRPASSSRRAPPRTPPGCLPASHTRPASCRSPAACCYTRSAARWSCCNCCWWPRM